MHKLIIAIAAVAGMALSLQARSATVPYEAPAPFDGHTGVTLFEDVQFIQGSDGHVSKIGQIDSGWYQLTLSDFEFPGAFEDLRVAITTATRVVSIVDLEEGFNQAINYLQLNNDDSYYLSVYGVAAGAGYALYGVQLAQYLPSPVPVPASLVLLLSGLLAWGATGLKRAATA